MSSYNVDPNIIECNFFENFINTILSENFNQNKFNHDHIIVTKYSKSGYMLELYDFILILKIKIQFSFKMQM